MERVKGRAWLLLLALAVVEVIGHIVVQARVVDDEDWAAAAAIVRAEHQPGDLIVAAPGWSDPLLRRELGELISLEDAGYADLAQYERLWTLSIRGHRPDVAPDSVPELDRQVGRVRVLRWDLQPDEVLYDFVEHINEAGVTIHRGQVATPCPFRRFPSAQGGRLGDGAMAPRERHVCDASDQALWVGATVQDTLDLSPRYCVYQHAAGVGPVRALFEDVPLGDTIILYGDLYYEDERYENQGQVEVTVRVNGTEVGQMIHRDGDGWKRTVISTEGLPARGDVAVEVTAGAPANRSMCWAATTRVGNR